MTPLKKALALALVAIGGSSCVPLHLAHLGHHRWRAEHESTIVIRPGHAHSRHCGHQHYTGRSHYSVRHTHGSGCGHHFAGGIWIGH